MKKFLLSLAAVTSCLVATAEEKTATVIYEKGTSAETAWAEADLSTYTHSQYLTLSLDENFGLKAKSKNGTEAATYTIAPTENSIINVEAEVALTSGIGRYLPSGSYFRFGNIYVMENCQDQSHAYSLNEPTADNITKFAVSGAYRAGLTNAGSLKISIEINTASNTLNSLKVTSADGEKSYVDVKDATLTNADYTSFAIGYIKSGSMTADQYEALKSIKITETEQEVATTSYAIKFVDEENNSIKDDVTGTSTVGASISASEAQMAAINMNGQKYIYKSGNDAMTLAADAESNVMTLVFRKAVSVNYVVKAMCGEEEIAEIAKGTAFEGDAKSIVFSRFILKDGAFYSTTNLSGDFFHYAATMGETDGNFTINYTKMEKEVVFYSEAEDIEGMTVGEGNSTRASNGKTGRSDNEVIVTNLAPGKYKIFATVQGNTGATATFTVGEATFEAATTGSAADKTSEEIVVNEATDVVLKCTGMGSAKGLDLVYIEKTGDVEPEIPTAIKKNVKKVSNVIYDLNGRVVTNPTKGLYIKSNKKFIEK